MNKLFISLLTLLVSLSASAQPKYWVDQSNKIVAIVANPTLNVGVVKLEVDDNYYGRLDFSLNYVSADMGNQFQTIMKGFPDYRSQRVVVERQGLYRLQIPILGLSRDVDPKPGSEGPYIEEAIYLTKAQYKAAQTELAAGRPLVQIAGRLAGTVPMTKVIEHKEIDNAICGQIIGNDPSVSSVIWMSNSVVSNAFYNMDIQYDSTRLALVQDIKQNCFELAQPAQVASFSDLMKVQLKVKVLERPLIGETSKRVYDRQEFSLSYEMNQNGVR